MKKTATKLLLIVFFAKNVSGFELGQLSTLVRDDGMESAKIELDHANGDEELYKINYLNTIFYKTEFEEDKEKMEINMTGVKDFIRYSCSFPNKKKKTSTNELLNYLNNTLSTDLHKAVCECDKEKESKQIACIIKKKKEHFKSEKICIIHTHEEFYKMSKANEDWSGSSTIDDICGLSYKISVSRKKDSFGLEETVLKREPVSTERKKKPLTLSKPIEKYCEDRKKIFQFSSLEKPTYKNECSRTVVVW